MFFDTARARVQLQGGQPLRLADAHGARLRTLCGTAWVTIDNDPRDIVLEAGDSFVVDSGAPVVITSLGGAAALELAEPARSRADAPRSWRRARRLWRVWRDGFAAGQSVSRAAA